MSCTDLVYNFADIRAVHVEVTNKCNALCPLCARSIHGAAENPNLDLSELTADDVRRILPPDVVSQLYRVYFNGNLGDPCVSHQLLDIIAYLKGCKADLEIGVHTNGGMRNPEWWRELGKLVSGPRDQLHFGIDGLADTNHLYRINVKWDRLMANAQAFIDGGGAAYWDYIGFKHNEHQLEEARALAQRMGFRALILKKTGRIVVNSPGANKPVAAFPVYDRDHNFSHLIENPQDEDLRNIAGGQEPLPWQQFFPQRMQLDVSRNLEREREFTQRHAQTDFSEADSSSVDCVVRKDKSVFLDCHGHILPCCWVAWPLYSFWAEPESLQMREMLDSFGGSPTINAKLHRIQDIVEGPVFRWLASGWKKSSIRDGKPLICVKTCRASGNTTLGETPYTPAADSAS